jgi:hypothetical protein
VGFKAYARVFCHCVCTPRNASVAFDGEEWEFVASR